MAKSKKSASAKAKPKKGSAEARTKSHEDREKRLRQIETALIDGKPSTWIVGAVVASHGISEREVYREIIIVKERLKGEGAQVQEVRLAYLAQAIRRRNAMYREAMERGDIKAALAVEADFARLLGLYQEQSGAENTKSVKVTEKADGSLTVQIDKFAAAFEAEADRSREGDPEADGS